MTTSNEIRPLKNGYAYRKIEKLALDSFLGTARIEIFKDNQKVMQRDELLLFDYLDPIIDDMMQDPIFKKIKVIEYSYHANIIHEKENIFLLNWPIKFLFSYKFEQLEEYCNGKEIEILSGDLKDKIGLYGKKDKRFSKKNRRICKY